MANDINTVVLIGRLTKDPDYKTVGAKETSLANFTVAVNRSQGSGDFRKDVASFIPCVAWGKTADLVSQYMKKGNRIGIVGNIQQRSYDDKDGNKKYVVEVVVESVQFLESKSESGGSDQGGGSRESGSPSRNSPPPDDVPSHFSDEDIPF